MNKIYQIYPWYSFINKAFISYIDHSNIDKLPNGVFGVDGKTKILKEYIESLISSFDTQRLSNGQKYIILDTCRPVLNWRNDNGTIREFAKYDISNYIFSCGFPSIELFLCKLFNKYAKKYENRVIPNLYFLSFDNIDCIDTTEIINDLIGESLIDNHLNDKTMIFDLNDTIYADRKAEPPPYLRTQVEIELKKQKLVS